MITYGLVLATDLRFAGPDSQNLTNILEEEKYMLALFRSFHLVH